MDGDDEEDEIFGQWLWPAELRYLLDHDVSNLFSKRMRERN